MCAEHATTIPTSSSRVALCVAALAAPMVLALPFIVVGVLNADPDQVRLSLRQPLVASLVAVVLLLGPVRDGRRSTREVGLIWVFAGAASAVAFLEPRDGHFLTSPLMPVTTAAVAGALASGIFSGLFRLLRRVAVTEVSQRYWPHGVFPGRFDVLDVVAYAVGLAACYGAERSGFCHLFPRAATQSGEAPTSGAR